MNARELDSGTMSMGTQFMWMCKQLLSMKVLLKCLTLCLVVLSSVVISVSLSIAFSASARAVVFKTFDATFGYLTRPVKGRNNNTNNLAAASPRTIRDFMIAKQKEWEGTSTGNGTPSGALPLHRNRDTNGRATGLLARLRRRESA